jgi:hypothetical protein
MEMRLGKTMVAIRWAAGHTSYGDRILIVTYKDCADGILDELRAEGFSNITPLFNMSGAERIATLASAVAEYEGEPHWFVINYEAFHNQPGILYQEWAVLICDESTALRNPQAKTAKLFVKRAGHIPHRAILSGLPNPKNATDFFTQFHFLQGMFMGYDLFWTWREKWFYQPTTQLAWMWQPKTGTRDAIKRELEQLAFTLTRAQAKVGGRFLKEKWVVDPSPKQKTYMREIEKDFTLNGYDTNWAPTRDLWLQRIAGGFDPNTLEQISDAKTKLILGKLKDGELQGVPVLVWFRFNEELKVFVAAAKKAGFRVCALYGDVPAAERGLLRREFQNGGFDIAALQIKVGRFGQDWSRADAAIYYSHTYDVEDWAQTRDRIVHPTQRRDLLLVNVITRGTIEEEVVDAQNEKYQDSRRYQRAVAEKYVARLKRVTRR